MTTLRHHTLNTFDWILIVGITAANTLYSLLSGHIDALGTLSAVTGVVCVVLVAKRSIWNYLFGLINVTTYALIAYRSQLYGDAILNAAYYLPMQFAGFALWRKHSSDQSRQSVQSRLMSRRARAVLLTGCAVLTALIGLVLDRFTADPQPYKDAATTLLSVVAQYLMVKAFAEQWILWIAVNAISVAMWIVCLGRGDEHAALMVVMWLCYLANSINGLVVWRRNAAAQREQMQQSQ